MTSRELVKSTLEFNNDKNRVPREMWYLPWAIEHHEEMHHRIKQDFPDDIGRVRVEYELPVITKGDPYAVGEYVDEWGCTFINIQKGVTGEVKNPIIPADDFDWDSAVNIHIPEELLSFDIGQVSSECEKTYLFSLSGCCPRPFEQLQFILGTENLYMDLLDRPKKMIEFMDKMHDFYCRLLTKWAKTDIDALCFMDDWGSQKSLLINPELWCGIFKPMYRDYIDIAHNYGKKIFTHSDGYTLDIIPHMIELGLDAINCQIFCIGVEKLKRFRGKITFWGELDRQKLLPCGTIDEIENAVKHIYENLWDKGGCIAQLEFGPGADPANVYHVFKTWDSFHRS